MPDEDADDERNRRWLDAESALERRPTPAAKHRQRRSLTVRIALVVCVPVIAVGIGALWDVYGSRTPATVRPGQGPAGQIVGVALAAAGVLIEIAGLIWMIRSGQFGPAWKSPLINLSWRQRRQLMSLIRRGDAAPAGWETIARYLANRMSHQYPYLLFASGLVVMYCGQALSGDDAFFAWSLPIFLVAFLIAAVIVVRDTRLAVRWLDLHGDSE